jgi:lipopolysaccharide/colanic/teichoic acid biosynthesis glycosyltransferase
MLIIASATSGRVWTGAALTASTTPIVATLVPFYLLAGLSADAFSIDTLSNRRRSVFLGVRTVLLACAGVVLTAFFLKAGEQISRMSLVIAGLFGAWFVAMARVALLTWSRRCFGTQLHSEILLIDDYPVAPPPGVFAIDAATLGLRSDMSDPLMLDRIGRLLAPADRVVIACTPERRRQWAMMLKGANIHAEIFSPELAELGPLGTASFAGSATLIVAAGSLDLRQRMVKRGLDMTLALIALLLLAPLLLLVTIAIKLDSSGPVFFVQDRVGRGNRLFGIYKFRSMHAESSDGAGNRSTRRDDDRITRVGRFIRATSIDELPQLLNIFKGEMSFVGPRPHALGSLAGDLLFWEVDERYWHRHACKPGLTGLAQIRGFRGATATQLDLSNRLQADLEYLSGWTLWRDLSIIIATMRVVVHRNAF